VLDVSGRAKVSAAAAIILITLPVVSACEQATPRPRRRRLRRPPAELPRLVRLGLFLCTVTPAARTQLLDVRIALGAGSLRCRRIAGASAARLVRLFFGRKEVMNGHRLRRRPRSGPKLAPRRGSGVRRFGCDAFERTRGRCISVEAEGGAQQIPAIGLGDLIEHADEQLWVRAHQLVDTPVCLFACSPVRDERVADERVGRKPVDTRTSAQRLDSWQDRGDEIAEPQRTVVTDMWTHPLAGAEMCSQPPRSSSTVNSVPFVRVVRMAPFGSLRTFVGGCGSSTTVAHAPAMATMSSGSMCGFSTHQMKPPRVRSRVQRRPLLYTFRPNVLGGFAGPFVERTHSL